MYLVKKISNQSFNNKINLPKETHSTAMNIVMAAAVLVATAVPLFASDTDDKIESSFRKSYVYKTYLKDEHIAIKSKDGVVTLSGDVLDETHKPMAQDTVEALPGVKSVENNIVIKNDKSDTWLKMKVQTALVFHNNVKASSTEVSVKNGVVTLKGKAQNQAQKELTTEYAKEVEGVKEVKNEMTMAKPDDTLGEKIDDASITAQVKMTLMMHKSTGVIRTSVTTENGVVTLSGQAKNNAERDLVTKLTENVEGVKNVFNKMTIE
ncbi:BON domain-containing protein [Sulfuricurvum sp.]|uniref:BON domain-containing protein n=1 Tax=Sulfuricurvum sp. TaxID=2025608 RepID=UPI002617FF45|nr:BON domain-containing protein [Sulfuricurvum sp.]MDD2266141.1 BON domain-containing protein [Sulfuricurvum sp.]MDD2784070.1 BON domain-containing protein [Sulfuricurvum sp.]